MRPLSVVMFAALALGCAGPRKSATAHARAPKVAAAPVRTATLTAEDIVRLVSVSDAALSPDGKQVAFVRRVPRGAMDGPGGSRSVIWVVPTRGGEPRRYTAPDHSSAQPRWSPDGRWLGFRSSRPGDVGAQVYKISPKGGEPERLTDLEGGVRHFEWSPDGKTIAVLANKPKTQAERDAQKEGRDWVLSDVHGTSRRLFVIAPGAKPRMIGDPDMHVERFAWAPDGKRLVVVANARADVDAVMMYSGLFVATLDGGWSALTKTQGKLGALAWSPDGAKIAFLGASDLHDPTAGVLHVVDAAGGEAQALTLEYEGTGASVMWPGRLLLLANESTRTVLYAVDPSTGARKRVTPDGSPACRRVHVEDKMMACVGSTAAHPSELFVAPLGKPLKRRTDSNPWLAEKKLGRQEEVRWTAADGTALEGVLIHPVDGTKPAPLVVLPHGGPEGISLNDWGTRATYPAQLFATRGFAVFMPNYRGSQGRGVAFGKADQRDLGGKEFEDVLAGIDDLSSKGIIDANRVGMGGWSYGGYFSALAATKHSARFKAAMVGAAITNWMSFTGTTEIEHENSLVHWNLWPYAEPKLAWERSPMAHLRDAKTPTLIVHGQSDTRVPPTQAMELYRGLRHFDVHAEIALYPREGHGLGERAHQLHFAEMFVRFFETHVKG